MKRQSPSPSPLRIWYCVFDSEHDPVTHFIDSQLTPHPEKPFRSKLLMDSVKLIEGSELVERVREVTEEELLWVHSKELVEFVNGCWDSYSKLTGKEIELCLGIVPSLCRGVRVKPKVLYHQLGFYCFDASTPIGKNTARIARISAAIAIDAAKEVEANLSGDIPLPYVTYAMCRPPGHHTTRDMYGGYCYFNNIALAADLLSKKGKVAILDVDYHHGNGTQDIFYERKDVLFISIHADPEFEYPNYSGAADEIGIGEGLNFNKNYPLPAHTDWSTYQHSFNDGINQILKFDPLVLLISLGLDAADGDPICLFHLKPEDYYQMGSLLFDKVKKPTLVIQEGGYSNVIGACAAQFLKGLLQK